jgi:hypothetical protein
MGLLDDAIREHLELKRTRGADPTEVAREEAEALGPVRRDRGDTPAVTEDPGAMGDEDPDPLAPEDEPGSEDATRLHDVDTAFSAQEVESAPPPPAGRPFDAEADEPVGSVGSASTEPDEWGFDDEPEAEPEPEEDPLEETPDFLQETPEHDRLWFEQKPPRDFDFDA